VLGGLGLDIALKYRDYLLTKGFPPSHEVKESDLTEDQIRNLRNDHLKTLYEGDVAVDDTDDSKQVLFR